MFINNKYLKWYCSIINNAKLQHYSGYVEKHHVIPKSMGGNNIDNIVKLTAREHFICHWLLTKCVKKTHLYKMTAAFHRMQHAQSKYQNSRAYESNKRLFSKCMSEFQKGRIKSPEHLKKIANAKRGQKQTDATKEKISKARLGSKLSVEHRSQISQSLSHTYILISPTGELIQTNNLREFCEENSLSQKRLLRTQKSGKPVKKHALSDKPNTEGWIISSSIPR
jgi:hypothetical protein